MTPYRTPAEPSPPLPERPTPSAADLLLRAATRAADAAAGRPRMLAPTSSVSAVELLLRMGADGVEALLRAGIVTPEEVRRAKFPG